MKHLLTLDLKLHLTVNEETAWLLQSDTAEQVLRRCFPGITRAVIKAQVVDEEIVDNGVNALDLLASRVTPSAQEYVPTSKYYEL